MILFSCKTQKTKNDLIQQQILAVNNKLQSQDYTISITKFILRDGLVYEVPSDIKSSINISPKSISLYIPTFQGNNYIHLESFNFKYSLEEKDSGISLVAIKAKANGQIYNISILITEFGDSTIYVSEGDYNSMTLEGNLKI